MADLTKMEHAFDRFEAALRRVEVAMLRSQERDARAKLVAGEADALRHDRSRLAQELDDVRTGWRQQAGSEQDRRCHVADPGSPAQQFGRWLRYGRCRK
jgi:hypothetical protein